MVKTQTKDPLIKNKKISDLKLIDLTGKIFGKLIVIRKHDKRTSHNRVIWECLCECGKSCLVSGDQLKRKDNVSSKPTRSCGCLRNNSHNKIDDRELVMWKKLYNSTIIYRSKGHGNKSDITFEKFLDLSKSECHYCGIKNSSYYKDKCQSSDFILYYNGLDRIDSRLGYSADNVVSCCKYCNCAKNVMSKDEFLDFISRVYRYNFIDNQRLNH